MVPLPSSKLAAVMRPLAIIACSLPRLPGLSRTSLIPVLAVKGAT
jgi:hypothetical protein